ncbi:hypothetical protein MAR_024119 [Mya arenaria]|uniref:Uncharacterized protein n=1 Tax=Mya arenaria TaxID=6604 RepID=A0ABY7DSA1_MYAAR|nr:hypothetical protein MAR_024119 [Mya arenaria]
MSISFSLLLDGSTDLRSDEPESIYIRCSTNGKITERFCSLRTPQRHIFHAQLNGLGSDGASNMTGVKAGLAV